MYVPWGIKNKEKVIISNCPMHLVVERFLDLAYAFQQGMTNPAADLPN